MTLSFYGVLNPFIRTRNQPAEATSATLVLRRKLVYLTAPSNIFASNCHSDEHQADTSVEELRDNSGLALERDERVPSGIQIGPRRKTRF